MRYKLIVAYDGTNYAGWQIQNNANSIQNEMQEALKRLTGLDIVITASGRTDAGVHALGQVCHFDASISIPPERLADALNVHLPEDISVLSSSLAEEGFDSNRSAKRKTYVYKMYLAPRDNPLKDRYAVRIKGKIDTEKLFEVAKIFEGEHDFKAYCAARSQVKTTVRRVYGVDVSIVENMGSHDILVRVTGNGFLYNMVRTMVGTMLYYAMGSLALEDVLSSINEQDRDKVGKTMPPQGLCLENVVYD